MKLGVEKVSDKYVSNTNMILFFFNYVFERSDFLIHIYILYFKRYVKRGYSKENEECKINNIDGAT